MVAWLLPYTVSEVKNPPIKSAHVVWRWNGFKEKLKYKIIKSF